MKFTKTLCGIALATTFGTGIVHADEEAQQMLMDAMPVMHYSCATILAKADGDEDFVIDVVKKMTFVSLYNHSIDINDHANSDEEKEALRKKFIGEIRVGCNPDKNALLAGVIDSAVMTTLGLSQ
ncbi:MAG: hypothetical protein HN551_09780 [Tateyamaria sp.]|jgi:hypothetical protein|nr:hypothetical protein [Tateyamaria sp.]MCH9747331.1 hypothetical protein [Alphaproteobacteria bacterium]HAB36610.1 hypothetical protein [Paracoccaceae bacterium]MBT5301478.1 hypothetical protein [Tateyamaria sp.]MBT6343047.1 hypothetical protein [Tateyamaria sp.]